MGTESLATVLALVGAVILVAALISGLIERTNLPQVAVFLALGAALGPPGLGLLNITLESPVLKTVATLSLALVLFTDALTLNLKEVQKHWGLAGLVLGPGTLLSAGDEIRVTAQLTDAAASGTLVWSHATQTTIGNRRRGTLTCVPHAWQRHVILVLRRTPDPYVSVAPMQ